MFAPHRQVCFLLGNRMDTLLVLRLALQKITKITKQESTLYNVCLQPLLGESLKISQESKDGDSSGFPLEPPDEP